MNSKLTANMFEINRELESHKSRVSATDQLNNEIRVLTIRLQSNQFEIDRLSSQLSERAREVEELKNKGRFSVENDQYAYQIADLMHRLQCSIDEVSRLTSQLGELATLRLQFNEINSNYSSAGEEVLRLKHIIENKDREIDRSEETNPLRPTSSKSTKCPQSYSKPSPNSKG